MTSAERNAALALVGSELGLSRAALIAHYDLIADRVLQTRPAGRLPQVLDAAQVAKHLGVKRPWVYEHALELGGKQVGGRWLFTEEGLATALLASSGDTPLQERKPERRSGHSGGARRSKIDLLPVRGSGV